MSLGLFNCRLIQPAGDRSEEHTSELKSPCNIVCRLLLEKKKEHFRNIGVAEGDHTPDLMAASHALSQLSYSPINLLSFFFSEFRNIRQLPLTPKMDATW